MNMLKKFKAMLLLAVIGVTLNVTGDVVQLDWDPVAEASSYNVYTRINGSGNPFVKVATVDTNSFSTNITTTGRWDFYIKSQNLAGEGVQSATVVTPPVPPPPTNVVMTLSPSP